MNDSENDKTVVPESLIFDAPDYLLEFYVDIVNQGDAKIPITLLMDGFLVSGYLVGAQTFLRSTLDVIKSDEKGEHFYRKYINDRIDQYSDNDGSIRTVFIHLTDAKFFNNRIGLPETELGINFRGLLSKVSGFFLGAMQ